jgi:hypothetical protein
VPDCTERDLIFKERGELPPDFAVAREHFDEDWFPCQRLVELSAPGRAMLTAVSLLSRPDLHPYRHACR